MEGREERACCRHRAWNGLSRSLARSPMPVSCMSRLSMGRLSCMEWSVSQQGASKRPSLLPLLRATRSSHPLFHVTSRDTIIAFPSLVSSLTRLGHHVPRLRVTALAPQLPPPAAVRVLRDVGVVGRRWRLRTLAGGSAAVKTSTFEEKNVGLNTSVQAHMQLLGSVYEPPAGAQPEPAQPRAAKVSHLFSGPRMSRRRKTRPPKVVHRHRTSAHRANLEPSAGSSSWELRLPGAVAAGNRGHCLLDCRKSRALLARLHRVAATARCGRHLCGTRQTKHCHSMTQTTRWRPSIAAR